MEMGQITFYVPQIIFLFLVIIITSQNRTV